MNDLVVTPLTELERKLMKTLKEQQKQDRDELRAAFDAGYSAGYTAREFGRPGFVKEKDRDFNIWMTKREREKNSG